MDPITAGAISGAGNIAGSYLQNQANAEQAAEMMKFQGYMSSTAHQREVADLRAAGLNPILSALGSGASTPGGAQAQMENPLQGISKGMDTAIAMRQQNKDLQAKDAGIENTNSDTQNKKLTSALIENQTSASAKDIENKTMTNRLLRETLSAQVKKAKAEGDYSEINQLMGIINSGASSASQLLNPFKGIIQFPGKK